MDGYHGLEIHVSRPYSGGWTDMLDDHVEAHLAMIHVAHDSDNG